MAKIMQQMMPEMTMWICTRMGPRRTPKPPREQQQNAGKNDFRM
jgi:hypothetical protein